MINQESLPSKKQAINILVKDYGYNQEELEKRSIHNLRKILNSHIATGDVDIIENLTEEDATSGTIETSTIVGDPIIGTQAWHEFVMSKFASDEMSDGHPKVDGLRRVAQELIAEIIESEMDIIQAPSPVNYYIATAKCRIVYRHKVTGELHSFQDVADASAKNTDHPFKIHLSSTAATRAEGRVLRKILQLRNVIAAEEKAPDNAEADSVEPDIFCPTNSITNTQITLIDNMCARNNINVIKYINSGKNKYKTIKDMLQKTAAEALEYLHTYQQDPSIIPEYMRGYDATWQSSLN